MTNTARREIQIVDENGEIITNQGEILEVLHAAFPRSPLNNFRYAVVVEPDGRVFATLPADAEQITTTEVISVEDDDEAGDEQIEISTTYAVEIL